MSDKVPNDGTQGDKDRPSRRVVVTDCSDWEPDFPPEKCSRGQFITDIDEIAKHFPPIPDDEETDPPPPAES